MRKTPEERIAEARQAYGWAVEIIRKQFSKGLEELCDPKFLSRRYNQFLLKSDPIYVDLLKGMEDERLSKTFVSYWTIAHTLATRSRFWLEDAVALIILHQAKELKTRAATHVFSQSMLSDGYLKQEDAKGIADIGEYEREHLCDRKPWRTVIKTSALEAIDRLVGQQEREKVEERKPFVVRQWDKVQDEKVRGVDNQQMAKVASSFTGNEVSEVTIQCNLLVVEPDPLKGTVHAMAVRYINPKTISSHPARKQERVNLLRLYALLVQEKIFRDPVTIGVAVAELLPRYSGDFSLNDRYPDYFSAATYWNYEKLWNFIGVPFDVVTAAIQDVAQEFRKRLKDSLRALLPNARADALSQLLKRKRKDQNDPLRELLEDGGE